MRLCENIKHGLVPLFCVAICLMVIPGSGAREKSRGKFSKRDLNRTFEVLQQAAGEGKVPGGVGAIVRVEGLVDCRAFGFRSLSPHRLPMERDTLFDLAGLTQVVATGAALGILMEEDKIDADDPVLKFFPGFDSGVKKSLTVRHLVTHTSGLPTWKPFFKEHQGREAFLKALTGTPLIAKSGVRHQYSELGMMTLGFVIERVTGKPLDKYCEERIFRPLGMLETGFHPAPNQRQWSAATEFSSRRGGILWGVVHDDNADALGDVAGHAGLFSTAEDLALFCRMILLKGQAGEERILSAESIGQYGVVQTKDRQDDQGWGWRLRGAENSSAGDFFSPDSFGYTGFTGTSIWIDPERKVASILLTNRIHPSRDNPHIHALRRAFNTAVIEAYEGKRLVKEEKEEEKKKSDKKKKDDPFDNW